MDPEAHVAVTATNTTDAAFRAADRNLKQFQRSITGAKQIMASFGLVFSARAFLGWIGGAVRAAEATGEHAEAVKTTKETMEAMKRASDALALSVAEQLVPAMKALTAVFTGWRHIMGDDPFPFEEQINDVEANLTAMRAQLAASGGMSKEWRDNFQADIDAVSKSLDDLKKQQRQALGLDMGPEFRQDVQMRRAVEGMRRIGDAYDKFPKLKRPDIELDELVPLDGLEEVVVTARQMTVEELWKPFPAAAIARAFEPMKNQAKEAAVFMGENFRDAFSSWIMGAERDFSELLKRMATEMAVSGIFDAFASMFSGGTSGFAKFMSSFFGGSRANEGPVSAGMIYKVHPGEAFFAPGMDGSVRHLAGAGAPIIINQHNTFSGGDQRAQAAAIAANNARLKQELKAEIQDLTRRGRF